MFTGIIQRVGKVLQVKTTGPESMDLTLSNPFVEDDGHKLEMGESIACNGVCLTVTEFSLEKIHFNVSPETLARTSLGRLRSGSLVNLERSLRMGDRLSGHWVQGHVDGVARLIEVSEVNPGYFDLSFEVLDRGLLKYCVKKGSISIEGISLTIHDLQQKQFNVQIIPHTWNQTNLVDLKRGDLVNLEVDLVAKYIERFREWNP
jgi:riboflavin synthase